MLLVRTRLGPSSIHGIGAFAADPIPKGAIIWEFREGFDLRLTEEELQRLAPPAQEQALKYSYVESGHYILCADDARFFNHSENPNTDDTSELYTIAARDIAAGEELTSDYRTFDHGRHHDLHSTVA
jgi:SET domain-containing protein